MKITKPMVGQNRGVGELGKEFLALKSLRLCDGQGLGAQLGSDNWIEIPNQLCDFGQVTEPLQVLGLSPIKWGR